MVAIGYRTEKSHPDEGTAMSLRPDRFGVEVLPAGGFRVLGWYPGMTAQSVLAADSVAHVVLTESVAMWFDHYAGQCGQGVNSLVEGLLALYRRPQSVVGRALFTGPTKSSGVEGLTLDQAVVLVDRLLAHAHASGLDRQVLAASS
ncbi:hypothetical protein ACFQ7O_23880 [Streptomyces sp. NPDC056485]|uniref:hypothetical protein n=1 Tax=Streptomyces sp. NPDC056485 TaxID=3345834 RepID=UPI0036A04CCB